MTDQCRACRLGLAHCHGALIRHSAARPECTEDDCEAIDGVHELHIDCSAVGCVCDELGSPSAHRVG